MILPSVETSSRKVKVSGPMALTTVFPLRAPSATASAARSSTKIGWRR
jgi:hypothetical protein